MEYFGTNLREAGHYRWDIDGGMTYSRIGMITFSDLPFHPESLTNNLNKGEVIFYQGGGFTVIGIAGSPKDDRPGTKSVFWIKEIISKEEMIERIKANKTAMQIINAMPFAVNYPGLKSSAD